MNISMKNPCSKLQGISV